MRQEGGLLLCRIIPKFVGLVRCCVSEISTRARDCRCIKKLAGVEPPGVRPPPPPLCFLHKPAHQTSSSTVPGVVDRCEVLVDHREHVV